MGFTGPRDLTTWRSSVISKVNLACFVVPAHAVVRFPVPSLVHCQQVTRAPVATSWLAQPCRRTRRAGLMHCNCSVWTVLAITLRSSAYVKCHSGFADGVMFYRCGRSQPSLAAQIEGQAAIEVPYLGQPSCSVQSRASGPGAPAFSTTQDGTLDDSFLCCQLLVPTSKDELGRSRKKGG